MFLLVLFFSNKFIISQWISITKLLDFLKLGLHWIYGLPLVMFPFSFLKLNICAFICSFLFLQCCIHTSWSFANFIELKKLDFAQARTVKTDELQYVNLLKRLANTVKIQPPEREKIFINNISDEGVSTHNVWRIPIAQQQKMHTVWLEMGKQLE